MRVELNLPEEVLSHLEMLAKKRYLTRKKYMEIQLTNHVQLNKSKEEKKFQSK